MLADEGADEVQVCVINIGEGVRCDWEVNEPG